MSAASSPLTCETDWTLFPQTKAAQSFVSCVLLSQRSVHLPSPDCYCSVVYSADVLHVYHHMLVKLCQLWRAVWPLKWIAPLEQQSGAANCLFGGQVEASNRNKDQYTNLYQQSQINTNLTELSSVCFGGASFDRCDRFHSEPYHQPPPPLPHLLSSSSSLSVSTLPHRFVPLSTSSPSLDLSAGLSSTDLQSARIQAPDKPSVHCQHCQECL